MSTDNILFIQSLLRIYPPPAGSCILHAFEGSRSPHVGTTTIPRTHP
jgi:hypothetical protein